MMTKRHLNILIVSFLVLGLNEFIGGAASFSGRFQNAESKQPIRLRVLSYNILGGRNIDGSRNLNRIAKVINEIRPDLVSLQEVDRKTARMNGIDIPVVLSKLTGMNFVFGGAMDYDGGEYGVAILSKIPVETYKNYPLPHSKNREPRTALAAKLKWVDQSHEIIFISTHLDHKESPNDRITQANEINKIIAQYKNSRVILAGDLNCTPQSQPMAILLKEFKDTWKSQQDGFTFPSKEPTKRIDYILHDEQNPWSVTNVYTGPEINSSDSTWHTLLKITSDHLPLIADLELLVK